MNVKNLTSFDFPGIDVAKFAEWKALHLEMIREANILGFIFLGIGFIAWFLMPKRVYSIFDLYLAFVFSVFSIVRFRRVRQLKKELKISERLKARKKGIAFIE